MLSNNFIAGHWIVPTILILAFRKDFLSCEVYLIIVICEQLHNLTRTAIYN